ncbi:TonB-dependent receptor [Litorivivens sp.]|uniref:TonB-dependent receptor n=3 Tax=Litorivivens sp. TaxID=2020868 RepID=UPI003562B568
MNNDKTTKALIAALAAGLPLSATSVLASEARLEEVIVTAQKREQNLQDVPMAVTALGREMLQDNEINSVEDLTKLVPSMRFSPGDDPSNNSIRIRGVGTDVFSIAVEPNVSVVVDDVPVARTEMASFEFADLERIEVLRGPQGTLFGKNSTAGLIHVISRDPAPEFEAFTRISAEDRDSFPGHLMKTQAGVSGPITDNLGMRVTGFYKQIDGHLVDILQDDNLPDSETFGGRIKLLWDSGSDVIVRLNVEQQRNDGDSSPLVFRSASPQKTEKSQDVPYGEENRTVKTLGNNIADSINGGVTLKVDWDLGDYTLTSVSGWRGFEIKRNIDLLELDGEKYNVTYNGGERKIETLTQELRLTATSSDTLEYTLGALYFNNRTYNFFERYVEDIPVEAVFNTVSPQDIPPELQLLGLVPGGSLTQYGLTAGTARTENLGIFAQGTWHMTDRWHLTAGARYIIEKLTADVRRLQYTDLDLSGARIAETRVNIPNAEIDDRAVTGTVSLQYDWSDSSTVYTTISTGYRGGAFDYANSDLESAFRNPVAPEKALAFEIGSKSRLLDDKLELNIAVFSTVFNDFQAQVIEVGNEDSTNLVPSTQIRLDNAGELETQGVEIEFKAKPLASLFVTGSLLYNKAVFNEFVSQCFTGQQPGENGGRDVNGDGTCDNQDLAGESLANAPEWSASLTGRYEHPLNGEGSIAYAQLTSRWQDDVQFTTVQHPLTIQEAYSITDLRFGWRNTSGQMELAAYVNNVFAQHHVVSFFPLSVDNSREDVTHFVPPSADRIFGFSAGYQW